MKTFRYGGLVLVGAVSAVIAAGYGQQALSQTPAKNVPAKTVKPAQSLTLERLAARLSALEAENRELRERVMQLEKAPLSGMPLNGNVPDSSPSPSATIFFPPTSASALYWSQPLNSTDLYNRLYTQPRNLSPYGPPSRIPDPRDVDGMMLLRANPTTQP